VALSYDRRASQQLLAALSPTGFANSLVEYGRSGMWALDLQLRGYADKTGKWATLYVGLTKVLDLRHSGSGFSLHAHPTYATEANGWHASWQRTTADGWTMRWPQVENYLERVIPLVASRFLKEGAVQSAISGFQSDKLLVLDREAAITFGSAAEKRSVTTKLAGRLLAALERESPPAWWRAHPTSLGGECDALALDESGQLLAIEVKPANALSTIPWSLVQVRHYADLFNAWLTQSPEQAAVVITGMLEQRAALGLLRLGQKLTVDRPLTVKPVLAIDRRVPPQALERLRQVRDHLVAKGQDPKVELYLVNLVGRLDSLDP
jgi:hypothetical protein